MDSEILKICFEKGVLIDNELLNIFSETKDINSLKIILEKIKNNTSERIITKKTIIKNKEILNQVFSTLPFENKNEIEKVKVKLGLSIEISKEIQQENNKDKIEKKHEKQEHFLDNNVKILSNLNIKNKKLEVSDFVNYFKNRFIGFKNYLQESPHLNNLISINKISGSRSNLSVIGLVSDKIITKNNNIIFEIEDLTGKIKILISKDKKELFEKAEEVCLDSVLGFKCTGNREILFANDIIFPEASLPERKKSNIDESALFIGDLHFGSKKFLKNSFLNFIDYLNGKVKGTESEVNKIKYLFFVGDIVSGIGNYPNQEEDLEINDLEEQFIQLAKLLDKIRKDIKIIISPGNHDGVRLMEPQPILDEKYAWPLYELKNVILTPNPCLVNIGSNEDFSGFNVLTYHGFSFPYYANNIRKLMLKKAMNSPEEIMKYLLKFRHLAPSHGSSQYFPTENDFYFIKKIPDIFVSGHTHKSAVTYFNNILVISVSSWEEFTSYQEKFGNIPDHCKVPVFNLKTREIKILDFESEDNKKIKKEIKEKELSKMNNLKSQLNLVNKI